MLPRRQRLGNEMIIIDSVFPIELHSQIGDTHHRGKIILSIRFGCSELNGEYHSVFTTIWYTIAIITINMVMLGYFSICRP